MHVEFNLMWRVNYQVQFLRILAQLPQGGLTLEALEERHVANNSEYVFRTRDGDVQTLLVILKTNFVRANGRHDHNITFLALERIDSGNVKCAGLRRADKKFAL